MRRLYSFLLFLALPIVFMRLYLKGRKNPMYRLRWKERLGIVPEINKQNQKIIWIHAVSVGEVEATIPLVKKLFTEFPDLKIIMTTTTPTGAKAVERRYKEKYSNKIIHYYIPYDLVIFLQRFIDQVKADLLIIMETEVWPNLIHTCQKKTIPVMLANARMAKPSRQGYQRFSKLSRQMFSGITAIAAQTDQDAKRILSLGADADSIVVSGSLKFDQELPDDIGKIASELRQQIGAQRPVWIAASTHPDEESQVLEAHKQILKTFPDCLLILVPRHPERFDEVFGLCKRSTLTTTRHSLNQPIDKQIYLVDTMGDLLLFYAVSNVAFVAGSLVPTGGHNLIEPAGLGLPILMGPYTFKIEKIFQVFLDAGAAFRINNTRELAEKLFYLFKHEQQRLEVGSKARKLVDENKGAVDRHLQMIKKLCLDEG